MLISTNKYKHILVHSLAKLKYSIHFIYLYIFLYILSSLVLKLNEEKEKAFNFGSKYASICMVIADQKKNEAGEVESYTEVNNIEGSVKITADIYRKVFEQN